MNELRELKVWVAVNADLLKGRTVDEIAHMAVRCGFSRQVVAGWQASENFKGEI